MAMGVRLGRFLLVCGLHTAPSVFARVRAEEMRGLMTQEHSAAVCARPRLEGDKEGDQEGDDAARMHVTRPCWSARLPGRPRRCSLKR